MNSPSILSATFRRLDFLSAWKAIADRVLSLCRDSARRLRMGRAARARVESNFKFQAVTARLEGIYVRSLRERFVSA